MNKPIENIAKSLMYGAAAGLMIVSCHYMARMVNLAERAVELHFASPAPPPPRFSARPVPPGGALEQEEVKPYVILDN